MTPLQDACERLGTPHSTSRIRRYALAAAVAAGATLAAYAWWESTRTQIVRHRVVVPNLPPGLDGLRVLHISDTHFPADGASLERFAELIAELEYDIVFATGDYVETAAGWDTAVEAFSLLHAPLGVYASLGAHDYLSPVSTVAEWTDASLHRLLGGHRKLVDPSPFTNRLEALGVRVLRNARTQLEINGEILRIAGAGDDSVGMARLDLALPTDDDRGAANSLTVLLTHSPDAVLRLQRPPPLIFCGHTHGGQIRIPGYGAPVRHSRLVNRHQTAGVFRYRKAQVIVSQGFGTAVIPLRLLCPPQLALIELAACPPESGGDSDS